MIRVSKGQSQLSGWGHYAEPKHLVIKHVPAPYTIGDTISLDSVRTQDGLELEFTDGSLLKYNEAGNLLPAFTDVQVWSVPAEGTVVPNGLEYVTIYASYTTKKNKVLNATPVRVPIAVPSFMRIIVEEEPLVNEGRYENTIKRWLDEDYVDGHPYLNGDMGIKNAFGLDGVKIKAYWVSTIDGTVLRITDVENPQVVSLDCSTGSYDGHGYMNLGQIDGSQTVTRYRTGAADEEGEEVEIENAMQITLRTTLKGITLTDQVYIATNPVVNWGLYKLPTTYSGDTTITLDVDTYSKVSYKNDDILIGRYANDGNYYLSINFRYLVVGGWYEYTPTNTITLGDGRSGTLNQYCFWTYKSGANLFKVATYSYTCADGKVIWTKS